MVPKVANPSLADVQLRTADGDAVRLGQLLDRPTILVIPRYYGCLPCRGYLSQVSERLEDVRAAGGEALAVAVGADHQAKWLMEERGIGFPLLLDPERRVHEALELPRRWWVALNPRGWLNYARAITRGNRQGKVIEPNQLPGLALLDSDARAVWIHRGRALGDYPKLEEVIARLGQLAAGA
ncbi:MAG TPA: redoxin domain-containing protein [Solirubrobacterales bacterium]|nr:redoxin domain-containing protein [Solirubrobacterales bacterium]